MRKATVIRCAVGPARSRASPQFMIGTPTYRDKRAALDAWSARLEEIISGRDSVVEFPPPRVAAPDAPKGRQSRARASGRHYRARKILSGRETPDQPIQLSFEFVERGP